MSNVRPDELVKWRVSINWWWVSTRNMAAKWDTAASRNPQPLTQDDLERVATLSMLAPGTDVEELGQVSFIDNLFTLYENSEANESVGSNLSDVCRTQLEEDDDDETTNSV